MLKTYEGGCHCGAVRFTARVDVAVGTTKCNCSFCARVRLWSVMATDATFHLVSALDVLADYTGRNPVAHHFFCKTCGIHAFDRIDLPNMTGHVYYNVSVACLDGVDMDELMAAPVAYLDGLHDNWGERPAEIRHL
jgi:hypothetical protein